MSQYAPRVVQIKVPVDKIGEIIGPGGKNIRELSERTGTEIEIEEERRKNHLPIFFPIEREELKIGWLIDRRGRWKHICQSIRIRIGKIKTISK